VLVTLNEMALYVNELLFNGVLCILWKWWNKISDVIMVLMISYRSYHYLKEK